MRVYKAKIEDIPKIKYIYRSFDVAGWGFKIYSATNYIKEHISNGTCYIIKEKNNIAGAICLNIRYRICEIQTLAIQKRMRCNGIGKRLVSFAVRNGKRKGANSIKLWSHKKFKARDFYLKCGFEELPYYYSESCYVFKKVLK